MPQDEKLTSISLPEGLRRQFELLERRLFSLETLLAASICISVLLGTFLVLFFSDRLWNTPSWLRTVLFSLAALSFVLCSAWWTNHWIIRRRNLRDLAILVQRKYRRLGDRLLGIVELADEAKRPPNFSPELYRAAIDQVAEQSGKYSFPEAISAGRSRRQALIALAVFVLTLLPMLILPEAGWNAFKRLVLPLAYIPRFSLVELEGLPKTKIVAHGEPFEVAGQVKYRSFWKPVRLKARYALQNPLRAEVKEQAFKIPIPGQVQKGTLRIKVGDAYHDIQIEPAHRPALTGMLASVNYPDYLQYSNLLENAQSGSLTVVEGSKVQLTGGISRELANATFQLEGSAPQPISLSGREFSTPLLSTEGLTSISFSWIDKIGLSNSSPWRLDVQTEKDGAPSPAFPDLFRDTSILETEVLPIKVRAQDDFGIKAFGLLWEREGEGTNSPVVAEFRQQLTNAYTKVIEHTFSFSPAVMRIPADTSIEIRSFAVDFMPGRERSESPGYRIHILGNAQHAEMIRQNLESLLVHLEEITRLEERIASETQEMKELGKLDTAQVGKKIEELQKSQEQNAEALKQLAEEGMKSLREALRNPAFSEELLTQWSKDLHQMQKLANDEMKKASQSLQSASKNQQNQDAREQNLAEAAQKQDEILQKLQEMQEKVNKGLDELQALTLAQRLRKLAGEEKKLEEKLQNNITDTIGLLPKELPGRYVKANDSLSAQQLEAHGDTVKIQGEISRFYERTQKPNYGEVTKEMSEARTAEELERVRTLIQDNIGMEAMQNLADWAGRFVSWADKLEPQAEESQSGDGSGSGSGEGNDDQTGLKQLLALLRMREKQVNIQGRTRLLHDHFEEKSLWQDGAVLLAASQAKLNRDINRQAVDNPYAILDAPYEDAITAATDVESLLDKPRTDQVTTTAQDKSVGMLSDLINLLNEEAKKQSSSSKGQSQGEPEEMQFVMQMMGQQASAGMQQAPNQSGNRAGGTTDKAGTSPTGDMNGREGEGRSSARSSGLPENYPTEFREALEGYFKALEAEEK
jgi:hypothetical protein